MVVFRLFFIMVAACASFLMMMGAIAGVGLFAGQMLGVASHDDGARTTIFVIVAVLFFLFLRIMTRVFGGVTKDLASKSDAETAQKEARIMQDLHQGMTKMEQRVESLETLLIDRTRDESHGPSYRY